MRYVGAAVAFFAALVAVGMAAIFALIAFAGPHSKPLSEPLLTVLYIAAGLAVLILPPWAARAAFRAGSRRTDPTTRAAGDARPRAGRPSGSSSLGNAIAKGLGVALLVLVVVSLSRFL
jgi:hypothetical protein